MDHPSTPIIRVIREAPTRLSVAIGVARLAIFPMVLTFGIDSERT